jgi:hypothetical protein
VLGVRSRSSIKLTRNREQLRNELPQLSLIQTPKLKGQSIRVNVQKADCENGNAELKVVAQFAV